MPSADDFRRIALGMEGAIESEHMGHPDFRANGRIFATLYPDNQWGMVKLSPYQQQIFVRAKRGTFVPASGAWGRGGATSVRLDSADEATIREAMTLAWQNVVNKPAARRSKPKRLTRPIRRSKQGASGW